MEKSKLNVICGLKITSAVLGENKVTLSFENGSVLSIYNSHKLDGFIADNVQDLIGKVVSQVEDQMEIATIKFENDWAILVDMRDEAYMGPEAMQLRVPGEPIVIWN